MQGLLAVLDPSDFKYNLQHHSVKGLFGGEAEVQIVDWRLPPASASGGDSRTCPIHEGRRVALKVHHAPNGRGSFLQLADECDVEEEGGPARRADAASLRRPCLHCWRPWLGHVCAACAPVPRLSTCLLPSIHSSLLSAALNGMVNLRNEVNALMLLGDAGFAERVPRVLGIVQHRGDMKDLVRTWAGREGSQTSGATCRGVTVPLCGRVALAHSWQRLLAGRLTGPLSSRLLPQPLYGYAMPAYRYGSLASLIRDTCDRCVMESTCSASLAGQCRRCMLCACPTLCAGWGPLANSPLSHLTLLICPAGACRRACSPTSSPCARAQVRCMGWFPSGITDFACPSLPVMCRARIHCRPPTRADLRRRVPYTDAHPGAHPHRAGLHAAGQAVWSLGLGL